PAKPPVTWISASIPPASSATRWASPAFVRSATIPAERDEVITVSPRSWNARTMWAPSPPLAPVIRMRLMLLQRGLLRRAVIEAVEEQFVGAVRLVPEVDFGTEKEDLPFPDCSFGDRGAAIQVLLAPSPTGVENLGSAEPADRAGVLDLHRRLQPEDGVVVIKDVELFRHAVGKGVGVVDVHLQERAGDVELLAHERMLFFIRAHL